MNVSQDYVWFVLIDASLIQGLQSGPASMVSLLIEKKTGLQTGLDFKNRSRF